MVPGDAEKIMITRRLGKFRIQRHQLTTESWKSLGTLLGPFLIIRAEYLYSHDAVEYEAISDLFPMCDEALEIPRYELKWETEQVSENRWQLKLTGIKRL